MTLPSWVGELMDRPAPEFVHEVYRRAAGRAPDEYETSYFLHRLLIGGAGKNEVAWEMLRSAGYVGRTAGERFVIAAYREQMGRSPSAEELARGAVTVESGPLGRIALLRELGSAAAEWDDVLPAGAGLGQVLALDGEAFVRGAYGLAGRIPAADEVRLACGRLRSGAIGKRELLAELGVRGGERSGLFGIPVIGRLLHVAALVWNLPHLERELGALRHRQADLEVRCRVLEEEIASINNCPRAPTTS